MSDQFVRFNKRQNIIGRVANMKKELEELREDSNLLYADCERLSQERDAAIQRAEKAEAGLTEQKERAMVGRLHAMETKNRLQGLLEAHRRFHSKVGCPGGKDCYVCALEDAQKPSNGTLTIKRA